MTSIPQVSRILRTLFEQDAVELGRHMGLRQRRMQLSQLAWLLVLGWWKHPTAGPSTLARFAGELGVTLCKQDVDCHFTELTATWLLALLHRAVEYVVCAGPINLPLLQQFTAVLIEDGSSITLPSFLKKVWGGCGGSPSKEDHDPKNQAALKLTVRLDLLAGRLFGPYLQEGRRHELASVLRERHMPAGSLWIADLGYWTLQWLHQLSQQGVFFLMRYKAGIVLWAGKKRLDLLAVLPQVVGERLELLVDVGADKRLKNVRLLAERVPPEVAMQRQERIRESARRHNKPLNPLVMELAHWSLVLTNVPATRLTFVQIFALLRARWQIELLFKLWKEQGLVDDWQTSNPWRILCEVYAKLLAMVVQHWLMLLSCWDDPHHSLPAVAQVLRDQVPTLLHGLTGKFPLPRVIRLITQSVCGGCSIPARSTRLSTSRLLLSAFDPGLT
ncbi:MAG TPA: IS4 family transposase [Ktedonobacteraceae bacterium]|nr:IS4 family transposase [Ktedonobacteraceae bacterium]